MPCTFLWPEMPSFCGQEYIIIFTCITIVIAAPGSLLTAIVIARNATLRNEPTYLLICSLCVADLFVAMVAQPLFVVTLVMGSQYSCVLDRVYFACGWLSSVSSALGVIIITGDRYAFIVHPMRYQDLVTRKRAFISIGGVWIMGILFAILPLLFHNALVLHSIVLGITILISIFMIIIYSKVYRQISSPSPPMPAATVTGAKQKRQRQTTVTVLFIVLAFIGCWFPWATVSFVLALCNFMESNMFQKESAALKIYWIFLGLGYSNSALNVFIYCRKNVVLRKAICRFLANKGIPLISRYLKKSKKVIKNEKKRHISGHLNRAFVQDKPSNVKCADNDTVQSPQTIGTDQTC